MSSSGVDRKLMEKWDAIISQSIDEQATDFLKAFVDEFRGDKFEEVLDIAQEFKRYAPKKAGAADLEENAAHQFLEKRGETQTVATMRKYLKGIDFENNHNHSFLEYALWKWKKTPTEFFTELAKPKKGSEELEKAIAAYREVLAQKEARQNKMDDLDKVAAAGGVKGNAAAHELHQMKSEDKLHMNRKEITTAAKKRAAEKNATDTYAEEQQKLEAEKKKRDEEEKKKRDEARARIKERSSKWDGK